MMMGVISIPIVGNDILNPIPQSDKHVSRILRSARDCIRDRRTQEVQENEN